MAANALVQTRIDKAVKEEAAAILAEIGLTVSDAVRLMLITVVREHNLPFDPFIPNAETVAAMTEERDPGDPSFSTVEALIEHLDAPD